MEDPVMEEGYSIHLFWEAKALGIFVIVYTFISGCLSFYTWCLYRYSGQVVISISLLALAVSFQSLVSMSQAIIALNIWPTLMVDDYNFALTQWRNPDASLGHQPSRPTPYPEVSLILAVRIIGVFLFNVESLLFLFWNWILVCSVCNIKFPGLLTGRFHKISKWLALILPAVQTILINIPQVMASTIPQIILYNVFLVLPVTLGSMALAVILYKFARVRWSASWSRSAWSKKLRLWQLLDRGQSGISQSDSSRNGSSHAFSQTRSQNRNTMTEHDRPTTDNGRSSRSDEDRYLLLRFCFTFVLVTCFQCSFIFSQIVNSNAAWERKQPDAPKPQFGWTKSQQMTDFAFFLAGSSTGYFIFGLFGTTRECRNARRKLFQEIKERRQKRREERIEREVMEVEMHRFGHPQYQKEVQFGGVERNPRTIRMESLMMPEEARVGGNWSPLYHGRATGETWGGKRSPQYFTSISAG